MSVSHRILDSKLQLNTVLKTFNEIGVEAKYRDGGDGYTFYVIGNDTYGYTRMYVEEGVVTEFHQFGSGKRPISMLFNCFNFIAYVPDNPPCHSESELAEYYNDIANLPAMEFFKRHYPKEHEIREELNEKKEWFEEVHPELHAYITSLGRTLNSYRFEYAYVNHLPVEDVTKVDDVIQFMYQSLIDNEEMENL